MSCILFTPKKLKQLPCSSKKAWKSFTSSISPKLHNLHNLLKHPNNNSTVRRRTRRATRTTVGGLSYREYKYHPPSSVYVDKLYNNNNINNNNNISNYSSSSSSSNKGKGPNSSKRGEVNWKEYASKLPPIRGVDEKADEFISRFRQEMQLQREQSLVEFQDMLARTTV